MARLFEFEPGADTIFVTFPSLDTEQRLEKAGFAERWFRTDKINCVIVTCATNAWFQYEDWIDMLAAIKERCAGRKIITFGVSMGGYGALFASAALHARTTITVAPQFSFSPLKVPGDGRFGRIRSKIIAVHDDAEKCISKSSKNFVFYDPLHKRDAINLSMLSAHTHFEVVRVPFGGHTCTEILSFRGRWRGAIQQIARDEFCAIAFRSDARRLRKANPAYWDRLSVYCNQRGLVELASHAKAMACTRSA